jgi:plastocyanin
MFPELRTATGGSSRRQFLRTAVATAGVAGVASVDGVSAQSQSETIRLGGKIDGWQGREPDSIAGENNPTLSLESGTDYRVVWENLDGQGHNFALLDGNENVLQRTDIMSEQGETQTIDFTATEEMAEYVCEPHISSMRGSIESGDGTNTQASTTNTGDGEDEAATAASIVSEGPMVRIDTIVDGGMTAPLDLEVPANRDDRYYITDRVGQVYIYDGDGVRDEPFIDVSGQLTEITGEMGLLGIALHPNYQENRKFYLRYSAPSREGTPDNFDHTEVLSEFTANDDGFTADSDSERTLLEFPSPYDTHNSGAIAFGPEDDYLYVGMGDGGGGFDVGVGHVADWYERFDDGSGPDVSGNGQDVTENLLGSILRIDVNSQSDDKSYGIPEDNPLVLCQPSNDG